MTIQKIRIKTIDNDFHEETSELYVTTLGDHDIIFGTDWLHAHNPEVNWALPQIAFSRCPNTCTLSRKPLVITSKKPQTHTTSINALHPEEDDPQNQELTFSQDALESFLYNHSFTKYDDIAIRSKSTTSTKIAVENKPNTTSMIHIPAQYHKYSKVFSEQASHRLPDHQAWDHVIELKPGASMRNTGIYRLTPSKHAALKEYITDHLKRGYIRPSKSPMASPFFFVDKKDGKLRPIQDYQALNDVTIKNAAVLVFRSAQLISG